MMATLFHAIHGTLVGDLTGTGAMMFTLGEFAPSRPPRREGVWPCEGEFLIDGEPIGIIDESGVADPAVVRPPLRMLRCVDCGEAGGTLEAFDLVPTVRRYRHAKGCP